MRSNMVVSRETEKSLLLYKDLLVKWNSRINLVAPDSICDIDKRHILDGQALADYIYGKDDLKDSTLYDIGSGNGIPGVILSLLLGNNIHLVESDKRKCAFLHEVKYQTQASYIVNNIRAEQLAYTGDDVIVARGFASVAKIADIVSRETKTPPRMILLKGKKVNDELGELSKTYGFTYQKHTYHSDRVILDIRVEKKKA